MTNINVAVLLLATVLLLQSGAETLYRKPSRAELKKFFEGFVSKHSGFKDFVFGLPDNDVPHLTRYGPQDWGASVNCDVCKYAVEGMLLVISLGGTEEDLVRFVTKLCVDLKIEDPRDELFGVLTGRLLTPDEVCGFVIGDSCAQPYNPELMWNVTMTSTPKPPVIPPTPPPPSSPKLRFLHLTDMHIDRMYDAGSDAECGEPLCCRSNDGKPGPGKAGAGKWGDYRHCDLSPDLVENLFQHLATKKDQFDFIIFTGDIPAHDVWNQTRDAQMKAVTDFSDMFDKYLPKIPVYHCVGNHDSAPVNSFPPPFIADHNSQAWMNAALAASWMKWLPAQANETIMRGAFYTTLLRKGFRIVSINMNYCNTGNWWLLINSTDPAGQLQWLINVLQDAENNHEKVYILAHIPPGGKHCMKAWSWNYYKIVNRYESTIVAQFYGHSHNDFYFVFYDEVNFTRPTSVGYVPGSVTTFSNLNPGYRIYTSEGVYPGSNYVPIDFENYIVDLPKANNASTPPQWQFEYSAKVAYRLKSLYPSDWNDLIYRMKGNDTLFNRFHRYNSKSADDSPCTGSCKRNALCRLKTARSFDSNLCKDL
ncbi:sphingomyelin phosphodiesterase-like [Gigantopelta aegis]|uniref:sphingomyelin phosphodiesterase-like n=1 Tax=Gigantopelta aegis TaxID=1735272 RepID=UPI001B88BAD3|nr:sphingomyelin phosphodiesterase-like [Gigantopelta aegis]